MPDSLTVTVMLLSATCLMGILLIAAGVMAVLLVTRRGWRRSLQGAIWLGAVPLLAPAVFLVIGGAMASIMAPILKETAGGVIVDNVEIVDAAGEPAFVAVIEFTTRSGQLIRFEDPLAASNPPQYAVGQAVTVAFAPEAPEQAVIVEPSILTVPVVMLALAALAWPIGAAIGWYKFRGARLPN